MARFFDIEQDRYADMVLTNDLSVLDNRIHHCLQIEPREPAPAMRHVVGCPGTCGDSK